MKNNDRMLLDQQREKAAKWLVENFSREERYLIIYERDFQKYLSAFSADNFKSAEKREGLRWDFFFDYKGLTERMKEFKWSKKFLAQNGIDFVAVRNLFYTLFTAEEIAS